MKTDIDVEIYAYKFVTFHKVHNMKNDLVKKSNKI